MKLLYYIDNNIAIYVQRSTANPTLQMVNIQGVEGMNLFHYHTNHLSETLD